MDLIFDPVKMLEENVTSSVRNTHVSDTMLGIELYMQSAHWLKTYCNKCLCLQIWWGAGFWRRLWEGEAEEGEAHSVPSCIQGGSCNFCRTP